MAETTIAIYSDFLSALYKLPIGIQKKTLNFIKKFEENPRGPGINLEKIFNPYDDKFYSGRVDKTYRVILAIQESSNTYVLLWVDHHDEAYEWANTKKIEVNKLTGLLQLYDIIPVKEEVKSIVNKVFDKYTNEQLLALGVPELQMDFVRSLVTESDFFSNKKAFSNDVYEYLEFLVNGVNYNEVLELVRDLEEEEISEDIGKALSASKDVRSFKVVEGQEELDKMFDAPLEKWRIFLHPTQKKLVNRDFSGPARVSGEAGTGKTVVAMHRAKYLLGQGKKVLFTTFAANLVGDIETNIMKILSLQEAKKLDVKSIDSVIVSYLYSKNKKVKIIYDEDKLLNYWDKAILNANVDLELDAYFYMEEWRKVATPLDVLAVEKYVSVPRIGRGIRLDRTQRLKIWHVFEEYKELLDKDSVRDIDYATYEAREILKNNPDTPYDSIIVDEGQDISANAFKFLRQYAGVEHKNDLFIVGDSHQRIYKNKAVLSKCGINVKGRSSLLKINYRTTEETRKYAFSFLKGINFDDIDTEYLGNTTCQSLTHGETPVIQNFATYCDQLNYTIEEIKKLHNGNVNYEDICIVARTHKQIELAAIELNKAGIPCYEINSNKEDNTSEPGVRLATMHRVKGLEFRYVFVISVNKNIMPMPSMNVDKVDNDENNIIERCLLYVALTRAQIKAYVFSYGVPSGLIFNKAETEDTTQIKEEVDKYIVKCLEKQEFIVLEKEMECLTICSDMALSSNNSLVDELNAMDVTFQQALFHHIDYKQMDEVEVYNRAHVDRRLFSKIRSDVNFKPSRKTAICLCFGLMLDFDETIDLLEKAGFTLSHSSKGDIIISYFISKADYDLQTVNNVLYEYGEPILYV
ncbi:MAG: UvrD-helicase domain-containing protein [Bacilli bacterium]|nr:UvrD-helicase domain-containing protein [Bacilli bacterium]